MKRLIIFGIGQIAEVAHYLFTEDSAFEVSGFTVDANYCDRSEHLGIPVVPFETVTEAFPPDEYSIFVAIGYGDLNKKRSAKVVEARRKGYELASYASSRAWLWKGFRVEPNTMIMEHNTIQPYVTIGANCILWSGNHIGHHTRIGENVFIASHAVISGSVVVGDNSFIGVNATLRDNIVLGRDCVVGAGALVLSDGPDKAVYPGRQTEPSLVTSDRLRSI
ncbi:MAG: transferase [Rickettsiales bacterium]|nr:transferase [Rickettsiales bacterium]|tara:strand:+ start:830 stop:1492 length:663 start_codon:yes stop_codon:yes gene_type:complete